MGRLSQIPSIVGVKEASEKLERYDEYKATVVPDFLVFAGADPMGLPLMLKGAHGNMPVSGNALPKLCRELADLALAGKEEEATVLNEKLKNLLKVIFIEANP